MDKGLSQALSFGGQNPAPRSEHLALRQVLRRPEANMRCTKG